MASKYYVKWRSRAGVEMVSEFADMLLRTLFVISIERMGGHIVAEWVS